MHLFSGTLRAIALIFDVWVLYWAKDLKLMPEESPAEPPPPTENGNGNGAEAVPLTEEPVLVAKVIEEEIRLRDEAEPAEDLTGSKMSL